MSGAYLSEGRRLIRSADTAHALGTSFTQTEAVARKGIERKNPVMFGLGLQAVGDLRPHRATSGSITVGHGEGTPTDMGETSHQLTKTTDKTYHNPNKALDTLGHLYRLFREYRAGNAPTLLPVIPDDQAVLLKQFVAARSDVEKFEIFTRSRAYLELSDEQRKEVRDLMFSKEQRVKRTEQYLTSPELEEATAYWESIGRGRMFRPANEKYPEREWERVSTLPYYRLPGETIKPKLEQTRRFPYGQPKF